MEIPEGFEKIEYDTDDLFGFLSDPILAQRLHSHGLRQLMYHSILHYGFHSDESMIPSIAALYPYFLQRISVPQRIEMCNEALKLAESGGTSFNVWLPWIFLDPDPNVAASAAESYALLKPLSGGNPEYHGDPLGGPKEVLGWILGRDPDPEALPRCPGGLLGALLSLGDRRVNELLWSVKGKFRLEDVAAAVRCDSRFLANATIEFLIAWMGECRGDREDKLFGILASGLALHRRRASSDSVLEVERIFPVTESLENPMRVVRQWSLEEYTNQITPRLRELEAQETGHYKVMHTVLGVWGLQPVVDTGHANEEASTVELERVLFSSVNEQASGSGALLIDPLVGDQVDELLDEAALTTLLTWGIFHPFVPRLFHLEVYPLSSEAWEFLVLRRVAPGNAKQGIVGLVKKEVEDKSGLYCELAMGLGGHLDPIDGLPSHVVLQENLSETQAKAIFMEWAAPLGTPLLSEWIQRVRLHWLEPWDRVEAAASDPVFVGHLMGEKGKGPQATQEELDEWWTLVTDPQHVAVETSHMPALWEAAEDYLSKKVEEQ